MKEYWLQIYIKENYRKLGFSEISGPYDRGCDFVGIRKGKKVFIEAERKPYWFLNHGHNKDDIDFLIVMADDETPRELLPKNIIIVDPVDLEEKTRDARRYYAEEVAPIIQARREAEQKNYKDPGLLMLGQIAHSLRNLYAQVFEEDIYEDTPEDDSMSEAALTVASMYIWRYDLGKFAKTDKDRQIPMILEIWNRVSKYGTDAISESDWEHLTLWLGLLRNEYIMKY